MNKSYTGHVVFYKEVDDGSLKPIGEVNSCSIIDEAGPCYVHIYEDARHVFGLPCEPYDLFFNYRRTAWEWVRENFGTTWV